MKQATMKRLPVLLILLIAAVPALAGEPQSWAGVAEQIAGRIDEAETLYRKGRADEAQRVVADSYFGIFEKSEMEDALSARMGHDHAEEVEERFGDLRKAIKADKGIEVVRRLADDLRTALRKDGKALDDAGVPLHGKGAS